MKFTAQKLFLAVFGFVVLTVALAIKPSGVWAASLSLSPATASKNVNDTFSVDVVLDTEGAAVSGATAIISYDTAKLAVVDDDSSATGVNITPGSNLTQVLTNTVDTSAGKIRYDAGNLGASYTGRGVIATVHFKALSTGTAQASFVFDPSKTTDTSAVAAASGPNNLLTTVNDGSFTINTVGSNAGGGSLPTTGVLEDTLMLLGGGGLFMAISVILARKAIIGW